MPRTTNKGIRFTDEELTQVGLLRAQLPEYSSEADLLRHAALLGMLVLATSARRPGLPRYAGYAPDDLAALLRSRLMPAIDFLLGHGALPAMLAQRHEAEPELPSAPAIAEAVVAELEGLGTGFMEE